MKLMSRVKSVARNAIAKTIGWPEVIQMIRGGGSVQDAGPDRPFAQVEAVYRCTMTYVNAAYQLPLMIGTERDQLIESGPLADLMDRANPEQSLADVFADFVGWLLQTGRAHWIFTEMQGDRPTQIVAAGKNNMRPVFAGGQMARGGELIGWLWRKPGQRWEQATPVARDQQWHVTLRSFDENNNLDGLAIIDVVRRKINQVFKADSANERSLDNDMRISSIVSPDEPVDEDQWKEFVNQLRDQNEGYRNRNRSLFTSRKVNVSPQAANFKDMEFPGLLDRSVAAICVGFGFDPSAIGYPPPGGRFEFVKAAKASAWTDVLLPFYGWISDEFDRGVLSRFEEDRSMKWATMNKRTVTRAVSNREGSSFGYTAKCRRLRMPQAGNGKRLFAWFDDSGIPAVREAKLSLAKEGAVLIEKFKATPADVNDLFDIGLPPHPWQELAWQSFSESPIDPDQIGKKPGDDDPAGPQPDDEPADDPENDPEDEDGLRGVRRSTDVPKHVRRISGAQLTMMWQKWRASWAGIERAWASKQSRHVNELRREVLSNLFRIMPDARSIATATRRDLIGEVLFDIVEADGKLIAQVGPLLRTAYTLGGTQSMAEAAAAEGSDEVDPFNIAEPLVEQRLRQREVRVKETNRTLRRRLANTMAEGLDAGETTQQIAERLRKEFNYAGSRAATIARTEVGGAVEDARQEGRGQAGVPYKSWLWSRKETGRPWHMETEDITLATPIANDALFVLPKTGARTQYPRGSGLTAEDAANCGCTTLARYPGDSVKDARLIGHYVARGFLTFEELKQRGLTAA